MTIAQCGCGACNICNMEDCDQSETEFADEDVSTSTVTAFTGTIPGTFTATSEEDEDIGLPEHSRKVTLNIEAGAEEEGLLAHYVVFEEGIEPETVCQVDKVSFCFNAKASSDSTVTINEDVKDPADYGVKVAPCIIQGGVVFIHGLGTTVLNGDGWKQIAVSGLANTAFDKLITGSDPSADVVDDSEHPDFGIGAAGLKFGAIVFWEQRTGTADEIEEVAWLDNFCLTITPKTPSLCCLSNNIGFQVTGATVVYDGPNGDATTFICEYGNVINDAIDLMNSYLSSMLVLTKTTYPGADCAWRFTESTDVGTIPFPTFTVGVTVDAIVLQDGTTGDLTLIFVIGGTETTHFRLDATISGTLDECKCPEENPVTVEATVTYTPPSAYCAIPDFDTTVEITLTMLG